MNTKKAKLWDCHQSLHFSVFKDQAQGAQVRRSDRDRQCNPRGTPDTFNTRVTSLSHQEQEEVQMCTIC